MTNLFSSFDPSALFNLSLNWISVVVFLIFLPASSLFLQERARQMAWKKFKTALHWEFKSIFGGLIRPGTTWFLVSLFIFIFINNALGLFPYIFTARRHLSFALALALPFWLGHIFLSYTKQTNFALAHLVPKGTPVALIRFIVLIETIRNIIRPLTLSVRIIANITAGHLLLCLLRSSIRIQNSSIAIFPILALIILVVLEIAVSLIQAYVFTLLSSLYLEEVQTKTMINWQDSILKYIELQIQRISLLFLIVKK